MVKNVRCMKSKYFYLFLFILFSCQTRDKALETALQLAGENRSELERVLSHYSRVPEDSLKLRAAKFLISNMPGHYTLEGELINTYRAKIDTASIPYFAKKVLDISLSQTEIVQKHSKKKEDVEHIKSDFLIRHIDLSFDHLYRYSWLRDIPFNVFLEYILPYRFENERLDLWLDSLVISDQDLDKLSHNDDIKYSLSKIKLNFFSSVSLSDNGINYLETLIGQDLYADCYHINLKDYFKLRILALPAVIDCIPYYANRSGYHYWNRIVSPEWKNNEVLGALERRTAKVFQKTYSRNEIPIPDENEYIPDFFLNPFYKDISNEYLHTTNIVIGSAKKIQNYPSHAYLCVFNNLKWTPAVIGQLEKSHGNFKNIGKNIVYLSGYYRGNELYTLNYPFILNLKGEIEYLVPDTCDCQRIVLKRKYPSTENLYNYVSKLRNIIVEASNYFDFSVVDTVISKIETNAVVYAHGNITTGKEYRYWRLSSPTGVQIAEISFFDKNSNVLQVDTSFHDVPVFDNDPLTSMYIDENKKIVLDLKIPTQISKIVCVPRGDGNGIYPGNDYELFYHTLNGWKSLGRRIAVDYNLVYDNVPKGALLWLHNYTTGKEERIFTCQNGEIRFW